jgi:phospholipid/cholesterol/gamma-HCH transport system substrate-binding protein
MKDMESKLGLYFALAVVLALFILEYVGNFDIFHHGYHLHALFKNVQDLKVGNPVKMAGVPIGRVEKIKLTNGEVDVTMNLNRAEAKVRTDSVATISFTGLMAQNYVSIDFGSPDAPLAEEDRLLLTSEQADLGQLFAKLDKAANGVENLTRSFSGQKIDELLGPLTDTLKDNRTNFTATMSNIKVVTDRLVNGEGTVGKWFKEDTLDLTVRGAVSNLQSNFQSMATRVEGVTSDAHNLLTNADGVVTDARAGKGTVGQLLTDPTLYHEATGSMTNLHSILAKIDQGQGTVGQLINDDTFLKGAKLSLQKLDKATESLEDTGPLSILGTMLSSLF